MNMDYCVSAAMKYNMDGIRLLILYYDIMCQYWKNLKKRFRGNPFLHLLNGVQIQRAIGLFHIHSHIDSCFPRYAPSYIKGAGQIDGEVLETLWAVLNLIHSSTRRMSTANRRETLDDHMNDSNWKKLIGMGESFIVNPQGFPNRAAVHRLSKKLTDGVDSAKDANEAYLRLTDSADARTIEEWQAEADNAEDQRDANPEAMDIYEMKKMPVKTKAKLQLELLELQTTSAGKIACGLISQGIKIEEAQ